MHNHRRRSDDADELTIEVDTEQFQQNDIHLNDLLKKTFVNCLSCANISADMVLLPCLHSLCRRCVLTASECPQCKTNLTRVNNSESALIANVFIGGLHKLIECHSDTVKYCEYCKYDGKSKPASHRCAECGDSLCEICADAHKKTKVTRSHTILPFGEIKEGKHDELIRYRQKPLCQQHKEEQLNLYCERCRQGICRECQLLEHDGHACQSLEEAAQMSRETIKVDLHGVKEQIPYLSECLDTLKDYEDHLGSTSSSLKEKIEDFIGELHTMLDRYKDRLLSQLKDTMERESDVVVDKYGRLQHVLHSIQSSCYFTDALLKHGRNDEVVPLCDPVRKRMKYFINMEFDALPDKLQVQFTSGQGSEKAIEQLVGRLSLRSSPRPAVQLPPSQSHHHLAAATSMASLSYRPSSPPLSMTGQSEDGESILYGGGYDTRGGAEGLDNGDNESCVSICHSTRSRRSQASTNYRSHHPNAAQQQHRHHHDYNKFDKTSSVRQSSYIPRSVSSLPPLQPVVNLLLEFEARSNSDTRDIWPTGVAVSPHNGDIYVLDRDNKCVKMFTKDGVYKSQFGGKETNEQGRLCCPYDLAISPLGVVYVTDYHYEQVKCYSLAGDYQSSFGKGHLKHPRGICITSGGRVAVTDCRLRQVIVYEPPGVGSVGTGGSVGRPILSIAGSDLFTDPYYVSAAVDGCLVVTDWAAPHLKLFDPEGGLILQTGVGGIAGEAGDSTMNNESSMPQPYGVCSDEHGYIMLADNVHHRVHLLAPNGSPLRYLITKTDGLWHPMALTVDSENGNLIVTEALGKVKVFRYK